MKMIICSLWLVTGAVNAGFINQSLESDFRWSTKDQCESWAARDQAFAIVVGVIGGPLAIPLAIISSGFGHTGWSLQRHRCDY